jgi:hypothetical protein
MFFRKRKMTNEEYYKLFIKKVTLLNIPDSMYVIWNLVNNIQFNKPIPGSIRMRQEFDPNADSMSRRLMSVFEWELEFLCKEIIVYGLIGNRTQYNLSDIRCTGELANDMRRLEDSIYNESKSNSGDNRILKHTFRMYHRQFTWQHPMHISHIYRYYKIFSTPELSGLLKKQTGLTTFEIIQVGFTLASIFMKKYKHPLPIKSNIAAVPDEKIEMFVRAFATYLYDLQNQIAATNAYDENLFYKYNPMRESPLIIIENELYCPFVPMFLWQFTNGLYYRLYKDPIFSKPFGSAFQDYVGFIIRKVISPEKFRLIPETKYKVGKDVKDSIDWILEDSSSYLFIECKTKRLILSAQVQLLDDLDLNLELDKMASFIFQGYKTISDFRQGHYTHMGIEVNKSIFLMVMTLEDWYLSFRPSYFLSLRPLVEGKLNAEGIDVKIIDQVPYFIESIKGFERNIQLINHLGLNVYFTKLMANTIISDSEKFMFKELLIEEFNTEIVNETINKSKGN